MTNLPYAACLLSSPSPSGRGRGEGILQQMRTYIMLTVR